MNLHLNKRIEHYSQLAQEFKLNGFLYHSNRSCKYLSQDIPEVRRAVTEKTGVPGVIIEADHNDPRLYTLESIQNQIGTFLELISAKKVQAAR
jgi:benzoyl-CoA reductase/2-hydroxyglutaryl-CoA dehydratase subunit BcrC/BadD/HgdB